MANQKVTLYIRIIHEGKRVHCKPVYVAKNRLKPLHAEGKGHHPEGEYYLRYAGKWEMVGNDPYVALDRLNERQTELRHGSEGRQQSGLIAPAAPVESISEIPAAAMPIRVTLEAAIHDYLTVGKAAEKDWRKHTLRCYALGLRLFRESCKKTFLDEISGGDLRQFRVFLRTVKTSVGKKIEPRTIYNHFLNVVSFLNTFGRNELVPQSEWPVYETKKVVSYDPEKLQRLLKFADADEGDVIEFFLGVGFRNGEGTHIEWHDIDLSNKEIHIYSKQERFGWQVKDTEQRIVGISDRLADRLSARHRPYPGEGLVFGNTKGNPDKHLLRIIKRVALRAGLNCGQCMGTYQRKRVPCSTRPVCRKWIIHALRKTWATFQARSGVDIVTIKDDLGHSSLATTQNYLASEDRRSPLRRQQINAADALISRPDEQSSVQ